MDLSFEPENFAMDGFDSEDFGLAKSFSNAPVLQSAPLAEFHNVSADETGREAMTAEANEIKAEGFCFKLAPTED